MSFVQKRSREKQAVTVVIGVMLMLSVLFLAAAQYQLVIVPQNEETDEIDHHRLVSSQMGEVQAGILAASSNSAPSAQKLTVGMEYPQDLIFGIIPEVHQPNPSGRISNNDFDSRIKVKNARGLGSARNYWPGGLDGNVCDDPNHCYGTTSFHYQANYNQFTDSPMMVYENTLIYDFYDRNNNDEYDTDDEYQFHSNQNLVQGRNINLIALTGNLQQSRVGPTTLQTIPVSAPSQTITIQSDTDVDSDPVTFEVPTRVPVELWRTEILPNQMKANPNTGESNPQGKIDSVKPVTGEDAVRITMLPGEVYNLKLSRVHVTTREEQSGVTTEKAAYIAWKGSDRITIRENSTVEIEAQARDRYNNPVPGIRTKSYARDQNNNCIGSFRSQHRDAPCDGNQQPGQQTSGENGDIAYAYVAPDVDADTSITIQLELDDANTVSNAAEEDSAELLAARPPSVSGFFPDLNVGQINEENTLRVTNVKLAEASVNAKNTVRATVRVDNTGPEPIDGEIAITGTGGFNATPNTLNLSSLQPQEPLNPGEHRRYMTRLSFEERGTQTVKFGSHRVNVRVNAPSTGIAPADITNRRAKEALVKPPSTFKDNDGVDETKESKNIPPVKYNTTTQQYDNTAIGDLSAFSNVGTISRDTGAPPSTLNGDESQRPESSLAIGLNTDGISENQIYTLFFTYEFDTNNNPGNVRYDIVDGANKRIDPDSNYYLTDENTKKTLAFQLTDEEASFVRSNKELNTVISSSSTTTDTPELRINDALLTSSNTPPDLTGPNANFERETIDASTETARTNDPIGITADITNTGTAATEKQITLFRTENNNDPQAVRNKDIIVNPGNRTTVTFTHYETNPGTYNFSIGELKPQTENATVKVTHR
jgi:hypothetical protein